MENHPSYSFISVPDARPLDWPFDSWVSPNEFALAQTWLTFRCIDADLEVQARKVTNILNINKFIFGFSKHFSSYAQIKLNGNSAFIAIDERVIYYSIYFILNKSPVLPESIKSKDFDVFEEAISVLKALEGEYQAQIVFLAANAIMKFIIGHELAHLGAGHSALGRDHARTREYVRVMEFSADRAALNGVWLILLHPLMTYNANSSIIHDASKAFGQALLLIYLFKHDEKRAYSMYPSIGERLLLIAGSCLTGCGGKNEIKMITASVNYAILSGIKSGLEIASCAGSAIQIPPEINKIANMSAPPQRLNCVGCSFWARQIYEAAIPKFEEIIKRSELLKFYNITTGGFNIGDYQLEKTYRNREKIICKLDHPFLLSRVKARLKFRWKSK